MPLDERQRLRQERARAGWDPPGPLPRGDRGEPDLVPGPGETLDAFAGHWRIFQLRGGHRYSTDDLLGAWFALDTLERLDRRVDRALDLGTGIGSVGLFLVWALADLHLTGLEAQAESLALARRSARYNGVAERVTYRAGDLRDARDLGAFPLVTASPPYWDPADGTLSEGPQKGPCRFELRGGVEAYMEAAHHHLAPGGIVGVVFDGRQRDRLEAAARSTGLDLYRYRDVVSKQGRPPLIGVAALTRPAEAPGPYAPEPPLVLRHADGTRTPEFRALRARMGMPPGR